MAARKRAVGFAERIIPGNTSVKAKVYYISETGEYLVRLYIGNRLIEDADYFTDDHDDAIATAKAMVEENRGN